MNRRKRLKAIQYRQYMAELSDRLWYAQRFNRLAEHMTRMNRLNAINVVSNRFLISRLLRPTVPIIVLDHTENMQRLKPTHDARTMHLIFEDQEAVIKRRLGELNIQSPAQKALFDKVIPELITPGRG